MIDKIKQWIEDYKKSDNQPLYDEIDALKIELKKLKDDNARLINASVNLTDSLVKQESENIALQSELDFLDEELKNQNTELEHWIMDNEDFEEVDKFAYKDKRKYNKIKYSVYPNELIQPDKFMVVKARQSIKNYSNIKTRAKYVGQFVDNKLKWTSDKVTKNIDDYYSSPVESLLDKKQDCEDHSFLAASIEPELGVVYGYAGKSGHAYNVFVYNNKLYGLETNSVYDINNNVSVFPIDNQSFYKINWIFTKNKTFKNTKQKTVHFGIIEQ